MPISRSSFSWVFCFRDIGFRQIGPNRLRAAAISTSESEQDREFVDLPESFVKGMNHVDVLKGKLDDSAAALGTELKDVAIGVTVRADNPHTAQAQQKRVEGIARLPTNRTLPFEVAYKLARFAIREPEALPKSLKAPLLRWWRKNSRMYREQHNLRRKMVAMRKHFYRQVAIKLVRRKKPIGLEIIDLSKFAEVKDEDNVLANTARANRVLVAPSELRDAIKHAASRDGVNFVEVGAAYTSKLCSHCGNINDKLRAELTWKCPSCDVEHDRDFNAAVNIACVALKKLGGVDAPNA